MSLKRERERCFHLISSLRPSCAVAGLTSEADVLESRLRGSVRLRHVGRRRLRMKLCRKTAATRWSVGGDSSAVASVASHFPAEELTAAFQITGLALVVARSAADSAPLFGSLHP